MYKLIKDNLTGKDACILRLSDNACIPFDPANTDYANFKKAVLDGAALQDAEGNTMSAEQATQFVKELP
jgi:uncharacterized protein YjbI with pentapeptide repeats